MLLLVCCPHCASFATWENEVLCLLLSTLDNTSTKGSYAAHFGKPGFASVAFFLFGRELALAILANMMQQGVEPEASTYKALISVCEKSKQPE